LKALLIEFDVNTGIRPGNINPNDPKLQCYGWQNLELSPQVEIRVIEDDRDVSQYEGVRGVTVLRNKTEINQAIDQNVPVRFSIDNDALLREHLRQKQIKLDEIPGRSQDVLKELFQKGIKGIRESKPVKV